MRHAILIPEKNENSICHASKNVSHFEIGVF